MTEIVKEEGNLYTVCLFIHSINPFSKIGGSKKFRKISIGEGQKILIMEGVLFWGEVGVYGRGVR